LKIDAVLLDIGDVLVRLDYQPAMLALEKGSGLSRQELTHRLDQKSRIDEYEAGALTTNQFFEHFCSLLEIQLTFEEFQGIWSSVFRFHEEGASGLVSPDLFRQLKREHLMIALSNTNEMQFSYLRGCQPLIGEFHGHVLSYQVGYLKPDPEIYLLALEKAGCEPSQSLFVDDLPENVQAARKLGIQGVVFRGEEDLRLELSELKVL